MTNPTLLALAATLLSTGCGPTFDPASLIATTRVVGARVEVEGAPDRATPLPGETANVTWLITAPNIPSPLRWAFAVCAPAAVEGGTSLRCDNAALGVFEGTSSPPRLSIPVPQADVLGSAARLIVYGEICVGLDSKPSFDPQSGIPSCTDGSGTTASLDLPLQQGDDANHNPEAERAFTFDGQPWPALAQGGDPCTDGPRAFAGTKNHVIGNTTAGSDRERYTALQGDPPVATPTRERLQISQFTTAGKLKSQFSFVEAPDDSDVATVEALWEAPSAAEVAATGEAVTFTFVTRDNRGGVDWTTRAVCVTR